MNIGPQEILLILVLALLIFGPRRLPDIARQIGKAVREVRKVSSEFEREVKTSFALDEHHSTYVTPKREARDDAPSTAGSEDAEQERSDEARPSDATEPSSDTAPAAEPEPQPAEASEAQTVIRPPQQQPGPETDRPDTTA